MYNCGVVNEIRKHRNRIIFKRVVNVMKTFTLVKLKVWSWITSKSQFAHFFFSDWYIDPLVCINLIMYSFKLYDGLPHVTFFEVI